MNKVMSKRILTIVLVISLLMSHLATSISVVNAADNETVVNDEQALEAEEVDALVDELLNDDLEVELDQLYEVDNDISLESEYALIEDEAGQLYEIGDEAAVSPNTDIDYLCMDPDERGWSWEFPHVPFPIYESEITLPYRRLTPSERAVWITEYLERGGSTAYELEVIRLVNDVRNRYDRDTVYLDPTLARAARFHSQIMATFGEAGNWSHHVGPYSVGGTGASLNLARVFGARGALNGNASTGSWNREPGSVVAGLLNSPGHCRSLLNPNNRYIGAGANVGSQWGGGMSHYLMLSNTSSVARLAATIEGGVIATDLGETSVGEFLADEEVSITAIVPTGYRFVRWESTPVVGLNDETAANTTFVMPTSDVTVTAVFEPDSSGSCYVIANGQFADQGGVNGIAGAEWRLCDDGLLEVGEGFISSFNAGISPWQDYNANIERIVFTGSMTAGISLRGLFTNLFNVTEIEGLTYFDTSSVTNMSWMFGWTGLTGGLSSLDLSSFDTSAVTDMSAMFRGAVGLTNLDLSHFNTSAVTDMSIMFSAARSLTSLDISNFNTSSVTNMSGMFTEVWGLTSLDLSHFDTSSVTDMSDMFTDARGLTSLDVSSFDTSAVTDMRGMFGWTNELLSLDVSNFDTSSVTDMSSMFSNARSLTRLDISNFDTSRVTHMGWMFSRASGLTSLDLSTFDTSSVIDMSSMFNGTSGLTSLGLSTFDTSQVIDMGWMFFEANGLTELDVSGWDTNGVEDMRRMFYEASNLQELDLSNWNTSSVMYMNDMFTRASSLNVLALGENFEFVVNDGPWFMSNDADLPAILQNTEFTGYWQNVGNGTVNNPQGEFVFTSAQLMDQFYGSEMADTFVWQRYNESICPIDAIAEGQFENQPGINGIAGATWCLLDDGTLEVSEGFINWSGLASPWSDYRSDIYEIEFTGPITAGTSLSNFFHSLENVTTIYGLEYFDTSRVTNMSGMFSWASSLRELDLSSWDVSNVTTMGSFSIWDMSGMFSFTTSLTTLDVSTWDTSNVENMNSMFWRTISLTELDVSGWDTGNVVDMYAMFGTTGVRTLDVSNWDTSSVINMGWMFRYATSLTNLDVSTWDTSNVVTTVLMFYRTRSLTNLDVSNWDTSSVTNMHGMFLEARELTSLNPSNWDVSNVTSMSNMFRAAESLTELDLSNWDVSNVTNMSDMFSGIWGTNSSSLATLDLSNWDTSNVTDMSGMFGGTTSLRQFVLPAGFSIADDLDLPSVPQDDGLTGYWQNVGSGTIDNPQGEFIFTSAQLLSPSNPPVSDTWVWQPANQSTLTPRETLSQLIAEAEARQQSNYTPRSWANMMSRLVMARSIYNNPNATEAQINEAITLLSAVLDDLVER